MMNKIEIRIKFGMFKNTNISERRNQSYYFEVSQPNIPLEKCATTDECSHNKYCT